MNRAWTVCGSALQSRQGVPARHRTCRGSLAHHPPVPVWTDGYNQTRLLRGARFIGCGLRIVMARYPVRRLPFLYKPVRNVSPRVVPEPGSCAAEELSGSQAMEKIRV